MFKLNSPISSKKMVPPSASSNLPFLRFSAPVYAPFSLPKSSLSIRFSLKAAQLTETNGLSALSLHWWIRWAITSLPVPLSPVIRTDAIVLPIVIASSLIFLAASLSPINLLVADIELICCFSWLFSIRTLASSCAFITVTINSSISTGLMK